MTSLADLLFAGDEDDASLCVHAGGRDRSLGEVRAAARSLAGELTAAGVGAGTPVGVMLPNAEVPAALFGVWAAGGVYVPLNPRLGASDLGHVLAVTDPAVVVTTEAHAERFPARPALVVAAGPERDADEADGRDSGRLRFRPADGPTDRHQVGVGGRRYDDDVALIQLTSGTTGRPKPVLLRHGGVRVLLDNVVGALRTGGGGRPTAAPMPNLVPVSLSLWAGIYQVLFARVVGAPVVVMEAFDPQELVGLVRRFGIRSTVLPPAAMVTLTEAPDLDSLEPLRYVRSITAPLSPLRARRFHDRFGVAVLNCYGQTEIGGEIVGWSAADWKAHGLAKLGAAGRPHAGVEVRVDEGTGELQVRTPALSAGYADGADLSDRLTDDGWFRTGDVGRVDDDGFVWIDGRLSDAVNRGGNKVFPAEVEEVLRLSPAVTDVAVAGVPDDRLGEVPWAFVVAARGATVDAAALEALCREHLAPYKVPVRFEAVMEIPRNEVGKVLRSQLAAAAVR